MKRCISILAIMTTVTLLLTACHDDQAGSNEQSVGSNTVAFIISRSSNLTRRADNAPAACASRNLSLPGDATDEKAFCLVETIGSLDDASPSIGATRATPVYTENLADVYSSFQATAYDGSSVYLEAEAFTPVTGSTKGEWSHTYPDGIRWPENDGGLLFFLQAPATPAGASNITFSPSANTIAFDYSSPAAAASQQDILFTSKHMKGSTKNTDNRVLFYHALAGVKFQVGDMDKQYTRITKVTIKQLQSKGHCVISPNYEGMDFDKSNKSGQVDKSATRSVWSSLSTPADFTQAFSGTVTYDQDTNDNHFADSFYNGDTEVDNLNDATASQTFFFIPQAKTQTEFIIEFTVTHDGDTQTYTRTVKTNIDWKAGDLITYTLVVNKCDVSVTDSMNEAKTVKSDVCITNTGNVTAYLRASIAMAWYYGTGDDATIVAPYGGTGTFAGLPGTGWLTGADGYYYYTLPVPAGQSPAALFTSFTAPTEAQEAPFPGAHLEFKILVQGVMYDKDKAKVNQAWGTVCSSGSATDKIVDQLTTLSE